MKQGRKITGGRYIKPKKKKLTGRQSQSRTTKLGETKKKLLKTRGGNKKLVTFQDDTANLVIEGKKSQKTLIKNVVETPSNVFLARQNILVKGAIIETELGRAKITNRPSQEGNIQAKLLENK